MGMPAAAASLLVFAAIAAMPVGSHQPAGGDSLIQCNNVDYVFVLNLQRKDCAENPAAFQQLLLEFAARLRQITEANIGVGIVTFSKQVEHRVPVTTDLSSVAKELKLLMAQSPKFDGIATGDAMVAAQQLLQKRVHQLGSLGSHGRKFLAVVAVSGDRNAGTHQTFAAFLKLHELATHVFAVNIAGGVSSKELFRISSDGTRGIFEASTFKEAALKTDQFVQVFCPCPLSWTRFDNCTASGLVQVQRFFYERMQDLPHNCILNSTVSMEQCNCPPNRVDRTDCQNGVIRITRIVFSRPENSTECIAQVASVVTEPCGRATGCEAFVCPPGSVCTVNNATSAISCKCTNPMDVFKTTGCERCGDREPTISFGPCINAVHEVAKTTFNRINDTNCKAVTNRSTAACSDCPANVTRQFGPCVQGLQQLIILFSNRNKVTGRCYREMRTVQVKCRLDHEFQCIGSALSGGQFVTFDSVHVDFPGPCSYLLSERVGSFQVHVQQAIPFTPLPFIPKIQSVTIIIGNTSFEISNELVLKVSGVFQPLPFMDVANSVEVFFVDDNIVFSSHELYLQTSGSAVTVGVRTRANLRGILGNCNGNKTDDFTDSAGRDVSQMTNRNAALGSSFQLTVCVTTPCCPVPTTPTCDTNTSQSAAGLDACGILRADPMSSFAHCGEDAMQPLFKSCVALFCRAQDNPAWQSSMACSVIEAAALQCFMQRASFNRSSYPVFRSPTFCPKTCGHNAEFVDNTDFCPKTCARHFFSTQSLGCATPFGFVARNALGQTPIPGCQCKPGFVLDGANCVLPNQCKCLSDLCIDRENRTLCELWKAQGHCNEFPLQMRYYCKLTCEQCRAPCQDQIRKATCQEVKANGLCNDSFYHQMCQLTCNPTDCECPPCKTVRGPCDAQFKNRQVSRICFAPDDTGHCQRNVTSTAFEPCGVCQTDTRSVDTRACDFCAQSQITRSQLNVRETTGQMRCLQVTSNVTTRSPGCECGFSSNSTACYRNSELFLISTMNTPSADCATCQATVNETLIRNVTCPKVVQIGECDTMVSNRRKVNITRGQVVNCQCNFVTEEFEEPCACPKPYWMPPVCQRNRELVRWHLAFKLVENRCVLVANSHKQEVPCPRRAETQPVCQGCTRILKHSWFERRNCKCVRTKKESVVGTCCCPKPVTIRSPCIGEHRIVKFTRYLLDNFECQSVTGENTERCACPSSKPIMECDSETGTLTVGQLVFALVAGTCTEVKKVNSKKIECKEMRVSHRGSCRLLKPGDTIKYKRVTYEMWERVEGTCRCRRTRRVKSVPCGCREPQVRLSKCPADCPVTSSQCPDHCHRARSVIEFRFEEGQCVPEDRDQEDMPCCCDKPLDKPPACENGRVLVIRKSDVKLVGKACILKESVVRNDVARTCDLKDVRKERLGSVVVEKSRVLRDCRCVWRKKIQHCPMRCPKSKRIVRCDSATGEQVVTKRHYRLHACRCLPVKREHRKAVECPEPKVEHANLCSSETPAMIVKRISFTVDDECRCKSEVEESRLPCEQDTCNQATQVRLACIQGQLYNVVTVHQKNEEDRCMPIEKRHRVETPKCKGHGKKKRVTSCIRGQKIQIERWLENRECKCQTKVRKRVLGPCVEDCEARNHGKPPQTRQQCDQETNQLVTLSLMWRLREGRCLHQWVATKKQAEPDCPAPQTRRLPCDHHTGTQRVELHEHSMQNCHCVSKVRVTTRKCSCKEPEVLGRHCDAHRGRIVVRMVKHEWNFDLDRCHVKLVRKFVPIPCPHEAQEKHGPCQNKRMEFQQIHFIRDRKTCRCIKKVHKKKISCHCPVVVRRDLCTGDRLVAVTTVTYRQFDLKTRRCVVVDQQRRQHRCSCQKPQVHKKCVDGKTLVKSVTYRLVNGECEADKTDESIATDCPKEPVIRTTDCNADTCHRKIMVFHRVVNPQTCGCKLQKVKTQFCRCCGCPVHRVQRRCVDGDRWSISMTIHSIRLDTCSRKCRKRVTVRTERVRCPERRIERWTSCQRCKSRKVIEKYHSVDCRCVRHVEKTDEIRACCCDPVTKLRTWCQESSGLFVTTERKQALSDFKCVWQTTHTPGPKTDCKLPEEPIIFGACDRATCMQSVTHVKSVLFKHNCSCGFEFVPSDSRVCCCPDTTPNVTTACIGDRTLQRITVTPVFDEVTHTCRPVTIINTTVITCGNGETRTSDPPCIGATRTIETTRSIPINCDCVNQTVQTRSEPCFCAPPTNFTPVCDSQGSFVHRQITEILVNGTCQKITVENKVPVVCNKIVRTDSTCVNSTCVETITKRKLRLNKVTCKCVEQTTLSFRSCCCPTTVQTRSDCVDNQNTNTRSGLTLNTTSGTCVPFNISNRSPDVPCTPLTREDRGCDSATGNRSIVVTQRAILNCICQVVSTNILQERCACPPSHSYQGACNKTNCQRRTTTVHFNPVTDLNGTLDCIQVVEHTHRPCCCTPLGQKRVEVRVECDHDTGSFLVSKSWKKFIITTGQCREFHKSSIKNVDCSGHFNGEDKWTNQGPCNHKTGLRTITVKWQALNKAKCKCKLHVKRHQEVCSCKHKRIVRKRFCDSETNQLVQKRRLFKLQEGTCVPQEETHREQVTCAEDKQVKESCNECNNIIVTSYNVLSGCKCERKESVQKRKCCCPEPQFHRKCHRNRIQMTTIRFNLSADKKSCVKLENNRYKRLKCKKSTLINGKCNRHSCITLIQEVRFHLNRCKCHRRIRVHKRRCCCPKARLRTTCHRDSLVHERTEHHLRDGTCVPQVSRKRSQVTCPETRMVGKSHCSPETGKRHVIFKAFTIRECRCVPKQLRKPELCACPKPRIERQPCTKRLKQRSVMKIVFKRHHGKCRLHKKLLYKEPCRCPSPVHKKVCDPSGRTLVLKSLSYRLTSVHGRRTCTSAEHFRQEKVHCSKRLTRPGPCMHERRKVFVTEHLVHHCRCVRKVRVRHVKCVIKSHERFQKTVCHNNHLTQITVVMDPETGEEREQKFTKRIECDQEPRVVPLSKRCESREKAKGLFRKVAIIRSVPHACSCKQLRRVKWVLCRCLGVKKGHRCVHNVIEQDYKEEHQAFHGHCRHKRSRRTREHRCPERPVTIEKGPCDKLSCTRRVMLNRCWMEHCRCRCRKRVGNEVCCTRPPVKKKFCKGNHMQFVSTRFKLEKRKRLAKDAETGEDWNKYEAKPETRSWSKPIHCPKTEVRQSCHKHSGVLTKRITVYRVVECKCKPRMHSVHTRCRCPPPQTHTGPCVNGRRKLTTKSYSLGKDEHCHQKLTNGWKICACPKPKRSSQCSGGRIRICTISFKRKNGCRPMRHCVYQDVACPPPSKKRGHCSRETNRAEIELSRFSVNPKTCHCDRDVVVRRVYCSCKHLNKKRRTCHENMWVTVSIQYKLVRGECLPDESVTHKAHLCNGHRTEIVPNSCERQSGLSNSGYEIARKVTSVPVNCRCKDEVRAYRIPCVCSLIPEFKTTETTECSANNKLVTKVKSFHLEHGKCKPRTQEKIKLVTCHGTRKRKTACLKDDLGDSFQYELTLKMRPQLCRCLWVIVKKVRVNCGCRPPSTQTVCVGNEILEKSAVSFSRPVELGAGCEPRTAISTTMVNCGEQSRTVRGPCDTSSCFAKEVTIRLKAKKCMCEPIKSIRKVRCCCPPLIVSPEKCNPATNQFEQVTTRFDLVNETCAMMQNTTFRSVSCDTRSNDTNTTACNSTTNTQTISVRDVAIANCQCISTFRSVSQPCGCPNTQRFEQGLCNGTQNFTIDRLFGLVFNASTRTCVEVLLQSTQRPCFCNAVSISVFCINNNINRRITFVEQLVNNTCVNTTIVNDFEKVCPNNGTSQQTRSECDPTTNTRSISVVNFVISNCTCVEQSTRSGEPCNCFQRNGGRVQTKICRNDNVTVTNVTFFFDGPGGVCLPQTLVTEDRVICKGIKEIREDCNEDAGKVEIRVFKLVPFACSCKWVEQPSRYEDCICKPPQTVRQCKHNKHHFVTTYHELIDGHCQKRQHNRTESIVCELNGEKAGVHYEKCEGGVRNVVTHTHRLHNCRCVSKRVEKQCPCVCPNSRSWSACKDHKIFSFHLSYNLVGCMCVKNLQVRESEALCAKRRVERSACIRGHDGDGYLTVVTSQPRVVDCHCQVEKREERVACECQPLENVERKCEGRSLTFITTRRQLADGCCQRVVVKTETRTVSCPLQSVRAASHCDQHGYRMLERTTWRAIDCQCEPQVRLEKQRCSKKCDVAPKLVRTTPCQKDICEKRMYFYYKNEHCKSQHLVITAKCCCPHSHQSSKKCLDQAFEIRDLFYKLENGVCNMASIVYRQEVACQRKERFEIATAASGNRIIIKCWHAVKDCRCQRFTDKQHEEQKDCPRPEVKNDCINEPEPRTVKAITHYIKQSEHGGCEKIEDVVEKPVTCPLDILHLGPCFKDDGRNAYVRKVTRTIFKKIHCICEPLETIQHEVCQCFQPRATTRCHNAKGVLIVTQCRYEVSPSGDMCHERSETQTVKVNCDETWRAPRIENLPEKNERDEEGKPDERRRRRRRDLSGMSDEEDNIVEGLEEASDGRFSKVLEREVRVGCVCRVQQRQRSCHSTCPEKTSRLHCEHGKKLYKVITTYSRCGPCECSYHVRKIPLRIRVPSRQTVYHKCHDCKQQVETINYRVLNCKAKIVRRHSTRFCCCRKTPRIKMTCQASQMLVKQTETERLTEDGRCVPEYHNSYTLVSCRRIIKETALSKCVDGKRSWRRETEKLHKCSCKRASERITRTCGFMACQSPIVRFGECVNCASKETRTEFIYNSVVNRCQPKRFHKIHNCCCSPPTETKKCVGNRLLLVTTCYKFHQKTGQCVKSETSKDITKKALKRCQETKRTTIGPCLENGLQVIVTLQPTLLDCTCHRSQTFRFVRCRCEPPSVTEACINGTVKFTRTTRHELDGTACKNVTHETFAQVECPVPSSSEGVCDATTCMRVITDISFNVSDCACQRLVNQRMEVCCCSPATQETRICERASNTQVTVRNFQDFDLTNRACVTRTSTDRSGTICAQNFVSVASNCDQFRNNSLFRTITETMFVPSGCDCVQQTTTRVELCGCDTPQQFTVCTAENRLQTFQIEFKPDANRTICLPNRVDISLRDVVCDMTVRSDVPPCSNGTRSASTGETRITVVSSWMARSGNCSCAMQTRSEEILCACPDSSQPKTICDRHRHQKLNVTTVFNLLVTGSIRQCIPTKVVTRLDFVRCQAPVVQLGQCQFGLMTVKTIVHKLHECSCVPKTYTHEQRCHKILPPCINKLPDWLCAELHRRHGICTRSFQNITADSNPELQQLAQMSALCDRECHRCDGCHSIGGKWKFKYADRKCLLTDTRYPSLSICKEAGFQRCLDKCKTDLSCRSFDFYLPSCQCTLARVDRHSLHDLLMPRHHMVGALPSDNRHRSAHRCNLYERICSVRVSTRLENVQLGCPSREITHKDSHCKCQSVSLGQGAYLYCYRTVTVTYYMRTPSGTCAKKSTFLRVACRACRDHLTPDKCQALDALGGCAIGFSARLCAKTCRLCECNGREFLRTGACDPKTSKREELAIRTEWVRGFRLCRVIVQKLVKACTPCIVGTVIQPQPCIGKHRFVLYTKTSLVRGQCQQTVKRKRFSCHGCYIGVLTSLGPCANGHRSVNSLFAVTDPHGKACTEEKISYEVSCHGCPEPVEKTLPCINGKRLRQVRYYVRPHGSDTCVEARFETEDKCGLLCHDQISEPECSYQKSTNQCAWNLMTRTVCPYTCKRC